MKLWLVTVIMYQSSFLMESSIVITPDGTKKYLQEVGPLIGGEISNCRWHPQLEVGPAIGGEITN